MGRFCCRPSSWCETQQPPEDRSRASSINVPLVRHSSITYVGSVSLLSGADETETRRARFSEHEAGDVVAQLDSGHVIESRVHATVDPAQARLARRGTVGVEVPDHTR